MDIGGIFDKLGDQKLGTVFGIAVTNFQMAKARSISFMEAINLQIQGAITEPHMPNLKHVWEELMSEDYTPFKPALMAAVAGYFLSEINLEPNVTKIGRLLTKLGTNVAVGSVIANLIFHATAAHSPLIDGRGGGSPSGSSPHSGYAY